MHIYEATLYERPKYGDSSPVIIEGRPVSREFVAETHSKARYKFWCELKDAWDEVRIQDIHVRSLSKRPPVIRPDAGWEERLDMVNRIIKVIGSHGRHFLSENSDRRELVEKPFFANFWVDKRSELWYRDRYKQNDVLVRHQDWPGFSDGGTLRSLVQHLADHIWHGKPISNHIVGPWPEWLCGGDLWGYGADEMQKVRDGIAAILEEK